MDWYNAVQTTNYATGKRIAGHSLQSYPLNDLLSHCFCSPVSIYNVTLVPDNVERKMYKV